MENFKAYAEISKTLKEELPDGEAVDGAKRLARLGKLVEVSDSRKLLVRHPRG